MRRTSWFVLLAAASTACGGSTSAGTSAPEPAAGPAAAAATGAAAVTPCTENGACRITVDVPDDQTAEFARRQANYRVYDGCPRTLGFTSADASKGAIPSAGPFSQTSFAISPIKGRYATVILWFGTSPAKIRVVDFNAGKVQKVSYGYLYNTGSLTNDAVADRTADSDQRRMCR